MAVDLSALEKLLTVKDVAEKFDVEARIVRREAREGNIPGTVQVLGKYGFDPDEVEGWEPPEPGERKVGVRREDGRQRYRIYLTADEFASLKDKFEIVDPREQAKARRAARKAKKAAATAGQAAAPAPAQAATEAAATLEGEADPFAEF